MYEDNLIGIDIEEDLQDYPIITEEQSQMVPKKNYEACKPRPCGLLTRLAKMSMAVLVAAFVVRMGKKLAKEAIRRPTSNSTDAAFSITTPHLPYDITSEL